MIFMQGKGISRGIAKGNIYFLPCPASAAHRIPVSDIEAEKARLAAAQEKAAAQLEELAEKCRREAGSECADLFAAQAMLAVDESYTERAWGILEEEQCSAEYAAETAGKEIAAVFAAMDNAYIQARADDIRDVAGRILNNLAGVPDTVIDSGEPVILAADELAPSELVRHRGRLSGFLTRKGSGGSHTAILARTMGIPAVCGLGDSLKEAYAGHMCCMDGGTGQAVLDPDGITAAAFEQKDQEQRERERLLEAVRGQRDVTPDGRELTVCCNISSPEDVDAVLAGDGHEIGLFRSEFLFLASGDCPTEEEQFRAYSAAASAMNGGRVVIRTLDIGSDKQADYFRLPEEQNPALGVRGVRFCLSRPEVFHTQLRAIYRASACGKVAVMFPMITSVWEVRECRRACREVMAELDAEGIPYDRDIETGIMIETPASVFVADELAREADFFSVGTNDLTQYILACDRQADGLDRFRDPHHPAVLRALKMAADAAHAAGIRIGVCGELAADPEMLEFFLAIGIDELSVAPPAVLPLRAQIRGRHSEQTDSAVFETENAGEKEWK